MGGDVVHHRAGFLDLRPGHLGDLEGGDLAERVLSGRKGRSHRRVLARIHHRVHRGDHPVRTHLLVRGLVRRPRPALRLVR